MSTLTYSSFILSRRVKMIAAVSMVAVLAGCSSTSDRFGPFENTDASYDPGHPNVTRDSIYTGSAGDNSPDSAVYSTDVTAQPLDSTASTQTTYTPPPTQNASYQPTNGAVTVNPGDTLYSISRNHNVAVGDLIAINNLQPPYPIQAGQRLLLPGSAGAQQASYSPTQTQSGSSQAQASSHTVQSGETLFSISRTYGHRAETVAAYNDITDPSRVRVGQVLRIPPAGWSGTTTQAAATQQQSTTTDDSLNITPTTARADDPVQEEQEVAVAAPPAADDNEVIEQDIPERTSSRFRWPVRGRVISEFGEKPDGSRNDGINLAVPSGTSVKAAENGVVAYAGNELEGYGSLVLVRHADNWVTAYAHNSELFVRRGDVVNRGQIIAKAGDSGNVTSPQLHFEIRRGAQAVDPMLHLAPNSVAGQ